jgi:hypothetical protein
MILPTLPGSEYELRIPEERADGARVFVSRKSLAAWCRSQLCECPTVAEVGVFAGDFSRWLLDVFHPSSLHLIDTFCTSDHVKQQFTANSHVSFVQNTFAREPRVRVHQGVSWDVLGGMPDDSLDYVYIDADHSYESVRRDIEAAHAKVRPGGIIQFNDYANYGSYERAPYGVLQAVNEYIESRDDVHVLGLSLERSGYHDLAVRVLEKSHAPLVVAPAPLVVAPLVVVTPCSRPENLELVKDSLDFTRIEAWHVIYDTRHAPFVRRFEGHPQIIESECAADGIAGHQIRNQFLDGLDGLNGLDGLDGLDGLNGLDRDRNKLVYFLDDDNTVHPSFWSLKLGTRGLWTFDMEYADGSVRRGDTPLVNQIDTAQFVFSSDIARGLRYDAAAYNADGFFVEEIWKRNRDAWTYTPVVAATYNRLRSSL